MSGRIVILGAGVDELVAAHILARAGRTVTLVGTPSERPVEGWIAPIVARGLPGVKSETGDPWASAPLPQGGYLELSQDFGRSVEAIRRVSPRDAAQWPAFCERMAKLARFFEKLYCAAPPNPLGMRFALGARLLGRQGLEDLLRTLPMSAAELLDDWFENDALKGLLGAAAIRHLQQGPRSGGTAFRLIEHQLGNPPGVFRAPRSVLSFSGFEVLPENPSQIVVRDASVTAVIVAGKEIPASCVISGLDPRRTLLELADPGWLDPELARGVAQIRRRGVVSRLSLTLERAPRFSSLVIAPSLDYLEKAYDHAKYSRVSEHPYVEARSDGSRLDVHVQYTPYGSAIRPEAVEKMLLPHLGGAAIVARKLSSPADLEKEEGWPQGQAWHAEPGLDQALWMRPVAELAGYRSPIDGLWLCGPAMHPGAAAPGAAGAIVAGEVLRRGG